MRRTLRVHVPGHEYDIVIGSGLLAEAGARMADVLPRKARHYRHRRNRGALHLPALEASLESVGIRHARIVLPPGEEAKSFPSLARLIDALLDQSPDRRTTIIAFGGGVIGDLTGFAASILLRGVDFIQIRRRFWPRWIVPSAVRRASTRPRGKNLVGSFYQPRLVLADISPPSHPAPPPASSRLRGSREIRAPGRRGFLRDGWKRTAIRRSQATRGFWLPSSIRAARPKRTS